MEKNVDLAYQTLDYIRDHPEEWDQRRYICGTTACFAGRAALISLGLRTEHQYHVEQSLNPEIWSIRECAMRALGWTPREASHVFYNRTRNFAVLERAVKEVLNGEVG